MLQIKSIQFDKDFDYGFTYQQLDMNAIEPETVTVKKSNMQPCTEIMRQIALIVPQVSHASGTKESKITSGATLEKMAFGRDKNGEYVDIVISIPVNNFSGNSQVKLPRAYYRTEGAQGQMDMFPSQLDRDIKELERMLQESLLRYLRTSLMIEESPEVSGEQDESNPDSDTNIIRMMTPSAIPDTSF